MIHKIIIILLKKKYLIIIHTLMITQDHNMIIKEIIKLIKETLKTNLTINLMMMKKIEIMEIQIQTLKDTLIADLKKLQETLQSLLDVKIRNKRGKKIITVRKIKELQKLTLKEIVSLR